MPYENPNVYIKFQGNCTCGAQDSGESCSCSTSSDNCSCCPVGTVSVFDADGEHAGCLTPSDAEQYVNGTHVPPSGYVKVIDTNGNYYGDLPPAQAIEYLNFIQNGTIGPVAGDTFNVVSPEVGPTSFYELNYVAGDLITDVINLLIDRTGVDESITISIQNQPVGDPFFISPSGTVTTMPNVNSSLDVQFGWSGLIAGSYTFTLRFASTNVVKEVPIRITLT